MSILSCQELSVQARTNGRRILQDISLQVDSGEVVALVGESGSGKTVLARAILGLLPAEFARQAARLEFAGRSLLHMSEPQLRHLRGAGIGMVFQEPLTALNPALRIGSQMSEALRAHRAMQAHEAHARCIELLERVRITDPAACLKRYPHEISGGMRQRVMLAAALLLSPQLLVADEPTTALDLMIARDVLALMSELARESGTALLLVTHDLPSVARFADRVVVMRAGHIEEHGATTQVMRAPASAYTRELLAAFPQRAALPAAGTNPVLTLEGVRASYVTARSATRVAVLHDIQLELSTREVVAVVGESGSGKTTLGRLVAGLKSADAGRIAAAGSATNRVQYVFQDPHSSLNPRLRVGDLIAEGLRCTRVPRPEVERRVREVVGQVGLDETYLRRFAHQLSGGQRQRVGIARAIVLRPDVVVADEAVAALDLTVRAKILDLLRDLQRELSFACLFITHDLAVVERIAHRVAVLKNGRLLEVGPRDDVLDRPLHPYTRALVSLTPRVELAANGGVLFHDRTLTPHAAPPGRRYFGDGAQRTVESPPGRAAELVEIAPGHFALCEAIA